MTVPPVFVVTAGIVSAVIVVLAVIVKKRAELALLPATVIHELAHIGAGKLFKGEKPSFTISLDASAVTTVAMRQVKGPITWFGTWIYAFVGYLAPPFIAWAIAIGIRDDWPVVTAILLAVLFVIAPLLCSNLKSVAITLVPSLVVVGGLILFRHNPDDLALVLAALAIHTAFSGTGQALMQIIAVIRRQAGVIDARILADMSFIPAIVYATVHLAASLAGAIAVLVILM